jgi:FtsH-binding integral membrane protein
MTIEQFLLWLALMGMMLTAMWWHMHTQEAERIIWWIVCAFLFVCILFFTMNQMSYPWTMP